MKASDLGELELYTTVYHGSATDFSDVDLSFGAGEGLEFGAGFYATPSQSIAAEYAFLAILESEQTYTFLHSFVYDIESASKNLKTESSLKYIKSHNITRLNKEVLNV